MESNLRELSLFTGGGGGLLASVLLGWRTIGAVEIDEWCCERVGQRRDEGHLGEWFPIWNMDIRDFNREVAPRYAGMVDVVSGGDPCQDNSAAAPRGSRNPSLGGDFIETVRIVRPKFVQRENPAVVRKEAPWTADRFIDELESLGYSAIPIKMRTCCLGGDNERARLYVLGARADAYNEPDIEVPETVCPVRKGSPETWQGASRISRREESSIFETLAQSDVCRTPDEVAGRMDRVRACANGQDPIVAATAWRLLTDT